MCLSLSRFSPLLCLVCSLARSLSLSSGIKSVRITDMSYYLPDSLTRAMILSLSHGSLPVNRPSISQEEHSRGSRSSDVFTYSDPHFTS